MRYEGPKPHHLLHQGKNKEDTNLQNNLLKENSHAFLESEFEENPSQRDKPFHEVFHETLLKRREMLFHKAIIDSGNLRTLNNEENESHERKYEGFESENEENQKKGNKLLQKLIIDPPEALLKHRKMLFHKAIIDTGDPGTMNRGEDENQQVKSLSDLRKYEDFESEAEENVNERNTSFDKTIVDANRVRSHRNEKDRNMSFHKTEKKPYVSDLSENFKKIQFEMKRRHQNSDEEDIIATASGAEDTDPEAYSDLRQNFEEFKFETEGSNKSPENKTKYDSNRMNLYSEKEDIIAAVSGAEATDQDLKYKMPPDLEKFEMQKHNISSQRTFRATQNKTKTISESNVKVQKKVVDMKRKNISSAKEATDINVHATQKSTIGSKEVRAVSVTETVTENGNSEKTRKELNRKPFIHISLPESVTESEKSSSVSEEATVPEKSENIKSNIAKNNNWKPLTLPGSSEKRKNVSLEKKDWHPISSSEAEPEKSENISNFVVKKNKNRVLLPKESLSIIANFEKKQLQKTMANSQSGNKLSSNKPRILQYGSYEIEEYQNVLLNDGPEKKHTPNIRAVGKNTEDEDIISPASGAEDTDPDKLKKTEPPTNTTVKGNWTLNGSSQSSKIKSKSNRTIKENREDTTNHNSNRIEKTKSTSQNIRKRKIGMKNGTAEKNSERFETTNRDNLKGIDSTKKLGVIRNYQISEYEDAEF